MGRVAGKIALVTGGASGLGLADAKILVEEGAQVILTDVDVAKGKLAASEIGPSATFIKHDVSSEQDWIDVINKIDEKIAQKTPKKETQIERVRVNFDS